LRCTDAISESAGNAAFLRNTTKQSASPKSFRPSPLRINVASFRARLPVRIMDQIRSPHICTPCSTMSRQIHCFAGGSVTLSADDMFDSKDERSNWTCFKDKSFDAKSLVCKFSPAILFQRLSTRAHESDGHGLPRAYQPGPLPPRSIASPNDAKRGPRHQGKAVPCRGQTFVQ